MRWIVLFALVLAACGSKKETGDKPTSGSDTPGSGASGSAGSGSPAASGGSGAAAGSGAGGGSAGDAVQAMTAIADEVCGCKDQACANGALAKASDLPKRFGSLQVTPELGAQLEAIQRRVGTCMHKIAKAAEGPSDPRLREPTKDDLAAYLKDIPGTGKLTATITTSMGAFHCELYPDKSPITVANFVGLATGKKPWRDPNTKSVVENKPFYAGLIFHRVIPGFMIQGGDPLGQGTGGPGYEFDDEVDNGLLVEAGCLAMANSGPSTNGSQFFIMEGRAQWLDRHHTVFGKCAELDLVKTITAVEKECPTCSKEDPRHDRPKTPVTIKSIAFARR